METSNWFTGPVIVAVVVGLIVGFAAGTYTAPSRTNGDAILNSEATTTTTTTTSDVTNVGTGDVNVSVADQVAGKAVTVTDVKLDSVAWVAVREYANNKLGYTLGAHRLAAGTYIADQIDLVQPTMAGKTYAVVVFYDNGDLAFDGKIDTLAEKDGKTFVATFVAK